MMKTDIEMKLESALVIEIKQIREAKIDGLFKSDIQVLRVDLSQLIIVSENGIIQGDYTNAKEIQFLKGQIRLSEKDGYDFIEKMYYFDGTATVNYLNNNFLVNVTYLNIYTN